MINMFPESKPKSKRRRKSRRKGLTDQEKAALGSEKLATLNPMVIPMLAVKIKEQPSNEFLSSSIAVITERPHTLSDKWIASLNKWVDSLTKAIMLDEPDVKEGDRISFDSLIVLKVCEPNLSAAYPMPAIICIEDRGWKWYFKTSKAREFKAGDSMSFTATVSCHKEGITFLRRPSKIKKIAKITTEELQAFMEKKSD